MAEARPPAKAAIAVTLAVVEGAPPPGDALLATLGREVIEVTAVPLARALASAEAGAGSVLIVWRPGGLDGDTVDRVVAWSHERTPAPGLIAWCPDGSAAATEHALRAGFDDVIVVPCSPRELAVRIRALHRRVHRTVARTPSRATRLRYRNLVLDPDSCELWVDGRAVGLTVTELTMVVALLRARGSVLTRAELLDQAWGGASFEVSERAVDNVVLRLRRKLGRPELVQTVRGVGFRLGRGDDPPADD